MLTADFTAAGASPPTKPPLFPRAPPLRVPPPPLAGSATCRAHSEARLNAALAMARCEGDRARIGTALVLDHAQERARLCGLVVRNTSKQAVQRTLET